MNNENQLPALFQGQLPKTPLELRYAICRLEHAMIGAAASGEFEESDFPLLHTFTPGKYTRTIFLPKGTVVVGRIHKFEHPHTLWTGHVIVVTEAGGMEELRGMHKGVSPAGVKRAILVLEDTIWSVEHPTDTQDLEEIERQVIAQSYTEIGWEDPVTNLQLTSKG